MTCSINDKHLQDATLTNPTINGKVTLDAAAVESFLAEFQPDLGDLIRVIAGEVTVEELKSGPTIKDPSFLGTALFDKEAAESFVSGLKIPLEAQLTESLRGRELQAVTFDATSTVNMAAAFDKNDTAAKMLLEALADGLRANLASYLMGQTLYNLDIIGGKLTGVELDNATAETLKIAHLDVETMHIDKALTVVPEVGEQLAKIVEGVHGHGELTNKDGELINGKGLLTTCDYDRLEALILKLTTIYGCDGKELTPADRRATCDDLRKLGEEVGKQLAELDVTDRVMEIIDRLGLVTKDYFDNKFNTLYLTVEGLAHRVEEVEDDVELIKLQVNNDVVTTVTMAKDPKTGEIVLTQDTLNMATGVRRKGVEVGRIAVGVKWPTGGKQGDILTSEGDGKDPTWKPAPDTTLATRDSSAVNLVGNGKKDTPLQAILVTSRRPNNTVTTESDGVYGAAMAMRPSKTLAHTLVPVVGSGPAEGIQTHPNLHELEVKLSKEAGNILKVGKDGLYVPTPEAGGMDVCEAFDKLPQSTSFGDKPKLIVQDAGECKVVQVSTTGIFSDIRAGAKASPATVIEGQTSRVTLSARNVSTVTVDKVRLIATMPTNNDPDNPYYIASEPVIDKPEGTTVKKVTDGTWDITPMRKGDVVEISYDIEFLTKGTRNFSATLDIMDDTVIDFDTADDYATASVSVAGREITNPDPVTCPMMNVEVSLDGKKYFPVTLVEVTSTSTSWGNTVAINPESAVLAKAISSPTGAKVDTIHVRSKVPITLQPVRGRGTKGHTGRNALVVNGVPANVGAMLTSFPITDESTMRPPDEGVVHVEGDVGAKQFRLKPLLEDAPGAGLYVVVRPSPECRPQAFGVLFYVERDKVSLTVSGDKKPPHKKTTVYGDDQLPQELTYVGGVKALTSLSNVDITPSEGLIITAKQGEGYDFRIEVSAGGALPDITTTGAVAVTPVYWGGSNTLVRAWNVVIDKSATPENSREDGPIKIDIVR